MFSAMTRPVKLPTGFKKNTSKPIITNSKPSNLLALSLFMLFYGIQLCQITWQQSMAEFPGLPVGLVYAPIPVAGALTFLFLIERVWVGHPSKDSVMYSDEAVELE